MQPNNHLLQTEQNIVPKTKVLSEEILSFYQNCGIITMSDAVSSTEDIIMNKILKQVHPYDIYFSESDKRWHTYIKDDMQPSGRKQLVRKKKGDLEKYLLEFYHVQLNQEKNTMTFGDLYASWLDYKNKYVGIEKGQLHPSTFRRYERDYDRYIKGTSFNDKLISKINAVDIESFLKDMVIKHNLTKRCLTNVSGYLKGAFFLARKLNLLEQNPYELVDLAPIRGFCKVIVKTDKDRVLSATDMNKLIATLHEKQAQNELYVQNYAIELATLTGMRVGELAALRWECIEDKFLRIDCSEHRIDYEDKTCEYYIGETKNGKHRFFPLWDEIKTLLEKVKSVQTKYGITSEYIFANKNGRVNSHTISCAMTRRCKDAGIDTRSIHAIRRTVSSYLRTYLPVATVAYMLGHLEETNDKHYNYDVSTDEAKVSCLKEMYQTFKQVA